MKKNLIISVFAIGTLASCSLFDKESDKENIETSLSAIDGTARWQLTSMSGSLSGVPPTTGDDMEWQESYLLNADGTFTKTRERDNSVTEAGGTYRFVTSPADVEYVELTYTSENSLIGNCTGDLKEILTVSGENELTGTSWSACDGPGLVYEKVFITESEQD